MHPVETKRIKDLANGDPQKEARLAAAACALVRCADGVPTDDPSYGYLMALQNAGGNFADEQKLLLQQSSRPGDLTRTFGPLFQYSWVDEYILDPASQNKVGTRLAGAAQGGVGIVGVIGSGALCTTGWGCAAGAFTGTISADYAQAGIRQSITGNATAPYGEQVLQSLGLNPQATAITYGVMGIAPAAMEAAALNRATAKLQFVNQTSRLSYSTEPFLTKGVVATQDVMQATQSRALVNELIAAGNSSAMAEDYAKRMLSSGTELPYRVVVAPGFELVKVVPKNSAGGDTVGSFSPFFMTRQQYDQLANLPAQKVADLLGLPAEQGVRGTQIGFDAYAMRPLPDAKPIVFVSRAAPVQQGGYTANGGAQQVLVPNRSLWTDPNQAKIGEIKPR